MTDTPNSPDMRETITKALVEATPGPWRVFEGCVYGLGTTAIDPVVHEFDESIQRERNNAHLIANAPEWLRSLLNQLDILQDACDGYEMSAKDAMAERDDLQSQLDAKDAEIKFWREAAETQKDNNIALLRKIDGYKDDIDANYRLRDDHKAMQTHLRIYSNYPLTWWGQDAKACLAALKETSP